MRLDNVRVAEFASHVAAADSADAAASRFQHC